MIEDVGPLDVLLVPTGGGGLLSGSALAATALAPGIAVYGVETVAGDDWVQSLARNERVTIPVPDTIADGMQTQAPGELTFPIVRALCAGVVTVTDDELRDAMRFAFERLKLVIEPSGAAALGRGAHRSSGDARQARRGNDQRRKRRRSNVRAFDRLADYIFIFGMLPQA